MNQEELLLDGKAYISSKRAAQIMGYAQDYVGQLCRAGSADCRRVNGLWYVTTASLESHKTTSAEIKARAFESMAPQLAYERAKQQETMLTFAGDEYVSAREGSQITGYNQDYVTQLAREGKVRGRQVGSRWYVARKDLVTNKEKNDALLAAVQADSVGILRNEQTSRDGAPGRAEIPIPNYYREEDAPLMPKLSAKTASIAAEGPLQVPLRAFESRFEEAPAAPTPIIRGGGAPRVVVHGPQRDRFSNFSSKVGKAVAGAALMLAVTFGGYYALGGQVSADKLIPYVSGVAEATDRTSSWDAVLDLLSGALADVLIYTRVD